VKQFPTAVLCTLLFLGYSGLRVLNFIAVDEVREFPDTRGYTQKASRPLWSMEDRIGPLGGIVIWWLKGRPPTVPLFYKLAGNTPNAIAMFQLIFSLLSWGVLALLVSRAIAVDWLKLFAFLLIQIFSLSSSVILWDGFILSDSISISLMVLFIACWLWLLESSHWYKAVLTIMVAFLWAFSRDTNAWVLLMLAGLLTIIGGLSRSRTYLLMAAAFTLVFVANEVSQKYSRRWVTPFINVVGKRILPNPEWTAYFGQLGMPVTPALMRLSGQLAWNHNWAFYKDPALEQFRDWVHKRGKLTYVRFLLAYSAMTIQEPLRNIESLIAPQLSYYWSPGFSPILNGVLAETIYPQEWALLWVSIMGTLVGIGFAFAVQEGRTRWLVPLILIVIAYPHLALVWHSDPNDIGRHALQASIHFRLGLWILLLFMADMLLSFNERQVCWSAVWRRRLGAHGTQTMFGNRAS